MQALAEKMETDMLTMYQEVPNVVTGADPGVLAELVTLRKTLNDLDVPKDQRFLALTSEREADFLNITNFLNANEGSDGAATQREGFLGRKYGFDLYENQSQPNHTKGTLSSAVPVTNGTPAAGAEIMNIDLGTLTGTVVPGDTFVIAGNTQRYAVTGTHTAAANAIVGLTFTPGLAAAPGDGVVCTFTLQTKGVSLAYHREAFALAMAPLSMRGNGKGAQIATVRDPRTNLTIRASMWYEPKDAESWIRFDALWGKKVLDGNRATRYEGPTV